MKKTVVVNGKEIAIKKIDFNAVCELEDLGFNITNIKDKTFSTIRALVAFNMGIDVVKASAEIEEHLKNGGTITDLTPMIEAVADSDFFQSLTK